jgi:hypothetical protein
MGTYTNAEVAYINLSLPADSDSQIAYRPDVSSIDTFGILTNGFVDRRVI